MSTKVCRTCEAEKPYSEYPRDYYQSRFSDGYNNTCRQCKNEQNKKWRAAKSEALKKQERAQRKTAHVTAMSGTKVCIQCAVEKPVDQFPKNYTMKDGRLNRCKLCERARTVAWQLANPGKVKAAYMRKASLARVFPSDTKQKCRTCGIEKLLAEFHSSIHGKFGVRASCKVCLLAKIKEKNRLDDTHRLRGLKWRQDNPARAKEILLAYRQKNRQKMRDRDNLRRVLKGNEIRERERLNRERNPAPNREKRARRRAAEVQASPKWLTWLHKAQIREFYEIAAARETQTGGKHHVDHIILLLGEGVNGLHVPWNLQVLTEFENCSKQNTLVGVWS